jgi:hypothetical protein
MGLFSVRRQGRRKTDTVWQPATPSADGVVFDK